MRNKRNWPGLPVILAFAGIVGCADDAPPIGLVRGTVTRGGKPVPSLTVNFMPPHGRPSWGITDGNGNYSLNWDADHDGAEVGTHRVNVAFVPGSPGEEFALAKKNARLPKEQKEIVSRFGGLDSSPLRYEVKPGSQVIDIALD